MLFRFGPVVAGLGLGLISFGFSGLRHYWRLFLLLLLMLSPYGFINDIFNFRLRFPEVTANISAFLLHYIGFSATYSGNIVKLPTGQVEVIYFCTGGLLIVWLLQLTLLMMVVVFPLTWKQKLGLVISAFLTGFLIGCIRVSLLAVVVNNKSLFDYWHGKTGGSIFMAFATITFAGLCNWILPVDFLAPIKSNLTNTKIKPKRALFLATTWLGVIFTSIYLIATKEPVGNAIFPGSLTINNWQQLDTKLLNQHKYKNPLTDDWEIVESGQDYQYSKTNQALAVQMRYVVNTRGNNNPFLLQLSEELREKAEENIQQQKGVGYYVLYHDNEQAYLTACINPRGGSTVNSPQFMQNRYKYDVTLKRLLPWVFVQYTLRDDRCIWTQLSIPLNTRIAKQMYPVLESVWQNNYYTWQLFLRKPV